MVQVVLTLGSVAFRSFEVPEKITLSGGQRLAVHQLIGGGCVVDALGEDPAKVSFSGIMSGADASARAQVLEAATATGGQIPIFWDSFFFTVIIEEFCVNYEKPWWIPFSLSCLVVLDPLALIASDVASAGNLVTADVATAVGLSGQAGIVLPLAGVGTVTALASTQGVLATAMAGAEVAMSSSSASFNGATNPSTGIASIGQVVSTAGQLAALSVMSGYINRAATNAAVAAL